MTTVAVHAQFAAPPSPPLASASFAGAAAEAAPPDLRRANALVAGGGIAGSRYFGVRMVSALLDDTACSGGHWPVARRASEVVLDVWQIPGTAVHAKKTL